MHASEMSNTHPRAKDRNQEALVACIEACFGCEQSCTACADACLGEEKLQMMVRCIRLNLDCADLCGAVGRVLSRQTETEWSIVSAQLQALVQVVRACGDECQQHADRHEHCRVCAESCRMCEESCNRLLAQAGASASA